ncbi:CAAX amino protease [Paraclostridium bifermentans]|uniref:Abi family protein n=1 Tax=Paraclostridium bifermentans TaxID=1490 RepID=UPI0021C4840C|nr:Abi family protein [Paraclostridium bifermentans]GKZ04268.1 CAAX amino protease [Paraclostridium bifermentans]GKZ06107.1 CAAX amino protease [Paraclostridium bifermentans]GKZ10759.1 CAAX amino protease [Paraclostridium bifermentans]
MDIEQQVEKTFKKRKTFDEQVSLLKERGLVIENEDEVKKILSRLNYYRLSGYFRYFYSSDKKFKEGTTFEEIYKLYQFDTELRRLFASLTEAIEINFRTYVAYYIAHKFGEYGHLDSDNFYNEEYHKEFLEILDKKVDQHKDKEYIKHHKNIYDGKIPIWVAIEILSFTDLSKLYSNMKNKDRGNIITNNYSDADVTNNSDIIRFWIQSLSEVRNKCAHYERLFDSKLKKYIKLPEQYKEYPIKGNSIFASLIIFRLLINDNIVWDTFVEKFNDIVVKYDFRNFHNMGFVKGWKDILTGKKTR